MQRCISVTYVRDLWLSIYPCNVRTRHMAGLGSFDLVYSVMLVLQWYCIIGCGNQWDKNPCLAFESIPKIVLREEAIKKGLRVME